MVFYQKVKWMLNIQNQQFSLESQATSPATELCSSYWNRTSIQWLPTLIIDIDIPVPLRQSSNGSQLFLSMTPSTILGFMAVLSKG